MSYGALGYAHVEAPAGLRARQWGWRCGRVWVCCCACGVPALLPVSASISARGDVEPVVACDRPSCGIEARVRLPGWRDWRA